MTVLDLNTVRATIEGRLATELAAAPVVPVVFHNQPYNPTPNSSWVQCLMTFGTNSYLTMDGDNSVLGVVVINIFTPQGAGPGANLVIGKRIRSLYNRIIVSGVYFDPPTGPEVVAAPSPEGYFQSQVRMTFQTFEDL
jgi:hypothetical protein